jgi:hypothetical protein
VQDSRRFNEFEASLPETSNTNEVPLGRDLTDCVLEFLRERVTPVAQWVAWSGGDPSLVVSVIANTLRSIADGLDEADG